MVGVVEGRNFERRLVEIIAGFRYSQKPPHTNMVDTKTTEVYAEFQKILRL